MRRGGSLRRALGALALAGTLAAPGCHPSAAAGRIPAGWRLTSAHTAVAPHAMIASNAPLASAAGVEILRRGGNAVDAAVAVGFALTVARPEAGNIGGGGFMSIRMADGRAAVVDYREVAPAAATRDMYLDANGELTDKSVIGHLAVGVPGSVAGMADALRRYGTLPLADVLAPAIRLAEEGFVVDSILFRSIESSRELIARFGGAAVFLPDSAPLAAGTRLRQPELARTLRAIAEQGPDAFYGGAIADLIVAEMERGAGIITKADLAAYRPVWREPIRSTYRGRTLLTVPPPSSGGVTITETLNILEQDTALAPFASARYVHLLASAYQRAFIDRNAKLGDPAFVQVPLEELTSKAYAARLRATIGDMRATPTPAVAAAMADGPSTTHYSVVDAAGNAVATTTTLNNSWGSGVFVGGGGFFLNDEMDDFAARPGHPNMFGLVQGEANAIQPGKRMLSAMAPTIVLDSAGAVQLVVGAAGGPTIITSVSQVILNVIDHRMSLADAMRAPRLHHQALPDAVRYEEGGLAPAVEDSLRAMGYTLQPVRAIANVNAVRRVPGGWEGAVEPRRGGVPVGY
ncbi:MAG TPA: gamma-glutamyltransferase [Gemmatimonadaceae bacterium]|nr:gamma-glutamyltransferase [Gemmatimonadaceae bacterium]